MISPEWNDRTDAMAGEVPYHTVTEPLRVRFIARPMTLT